MKGFYNIYLLGNLNLSNDGGDEDDKTKSENETINTKSSTFVQIRSIHQAEN